MSEVPLHGGRGDVGVLLGHVRALPEGGAG